MKTLRIFTTLLAVGLVAFVGIAGRADAHTSRKPHDPVVQLALLLDTSNSMDGLIDQARTRLWQIVNDLAEAECDGRRPRLEVALYEYGNNNLSSSSGYMRAVCGFTGDLDLISASLFALHTNGGDEFCGMVINRALSDLQWSHHASDLKMIFIAGNEPFTQGPVDFRPVVRGAAARGISVNTIFCGPAHEGIVTHWKDGAVFAGGTYASINQDKVIPHIDAPQDHRLALLNEELNKTYLAYGAAGRARAEVQKTQDANAAASAPGAMASRIAAKAGSLYQNSTWDLVDAVKEGAVELGELDADDMPEDLRGLAPKEQEAKIEAASKARADIQHKIKKLSKEREAYVENEMKKLSTDDADGLDEAIRKSVREQAGKKNYKFGGN